MSNVVAGGEGDAPSKSATKSSGIGPDIPIPDEAPQKNDENVSLKMIKIAKKLEDLNQQVHALQIQNRGMYLLCH